MTEKLYGDPEQMSIFDSMEQLLLEPIEMEHGKDYREKVELKINALSFLDGSMRDATPEEIECINKNIKERSYPTGVCFWDNWHLRKDDNYGINEIDTYISEVNSQYNFIAEVNSFPTPESYPHEDDRFYIPEEYTNMTIEELKIEQKKLLKEIKRRKQMKEIKIKYHSKDIEKIKNIEGKSDWYDLRSAEDVTLKAGEFKLINLGVSMKLPEGYEAHIVPRSSTFKNFGIIQTNHQAVIDNSYCGDNDIWRYPAYALKDTKIHVNDRICQFRIVEKQPKINFVEVDFLDGQDRGGIGSTGKQ